MEVTEEGFSEWMDSIDGVLLDCDGVLWRGGAAIEGAAETVAELRKLGKTLVFVTNNSTTSRVKYVEKMKKLGIEAKQEEVFGSAYAAVALLNHLEFPKDSKRVYVIGEKGLVEELSEGGFTAFGLEDGDKKFDFSFSKDHVDPDVGAVVVGFDREFNYRKLARASSYVRYNPGCLFLATNCDATFPAPDLFLPGGGTMVNAVEKAVQRPPDAVAGKPSDTFMKLISETIHLTPSRCLMVGDRLDTDIEFGNKMGADTLLVMSGVTHSEQLQAAKGLHKPKRWAHSLSSLLPFLKKLVKK